MSDLLLAIDAGTTHCRVSIFDSGGRRRAHAAGGCAVASDASGAAEQDAAGVWRLTRGLLRQAVAQCGSAEIRAVSLSVQGDAIIPVDYDGNPLHPALLGMDYRSAVQAESVARSLGGMRVFRRTGMRPHPLTSLSKILWLRQTKPELFRATRRILTYGDYLLSRLGGDAMIDDTMASRSMAYDLGRGGWSAWLLDRLSLDPALLSSIVAAGTPAGRMCRSLTEEIGLREPPLLVAGAHDQVCAALGAGAPLRVRSVVSTGTAEVLSAVLDRPALTRAMFDGHYPCYRYALPEAWFTFSLNHAGGILLEWFHHLVSGGSAASGSAPAGSAPASQDFDRVFSQLPEGPSPVMALPHFNGSGTPWCDVRSRGAVLGLTLSTEPGDIALALLEALAFELRINRDRLEAAGVRLGDTAAVGGGARSDAWLQIKADILGRPLRRPAVDDAAVLGAAILAGAGCGLFAGVREGIESMVPAAPTVEPRPHKAAAYDERFALYRDLYPALSPLHRRLASP